MRGMKELRLVEWRLGGIECVGPPRVGVIWEEMGARLTGGRQRDKEYGLELLRSLVIFTIVSY